MSQDHTKHPAYPPPSSQPHTHSGYPLYASQDRGPPATSQHLPSSHAATEELDSEAFARDYAGAHPGYQQPGVAYPPPPSPSTGEGEYLRGTMPHMEYPEKTASHPLVGMIPSLGQYPGMQPPMFQSYMQPTIIPLYSIRHVYQPQYASSFQSLYQPQPTADQHLSQYTEFPYPVDSSCPGLLQLPTKPNNESEATAGSTLPLYSLSMADKNRKLDEILGKRADQRTEEEKKFREDHLAARQSVHAMDASDRERRRQRKLSSLASESSGL